MKRPNVLIIHADQHRRDCLGCYGNPQVRTPNIDALAREGVMHTEHYSTYPVCTPSRYSFLCGQYPHQHLGWGNRCTLPPGLATFPRVMKASGYRTAAVGKMHFSPTYLDVGFEEMVLAEQDGDGRFDDDYHRYLMERGLADRTDIVDQRAEYRKDAPPEYWEQMGALCSDLPEEHYSTGYITREALKKLEGWNADTPNLLMVGYIKPHHPNDPPAEFAGMYDPDTIDPLPGYTPEVPEDDYARDSGYHDHRLLTPEKLKKSLAYYYTSITLIDGGVGELVSALKKKGLYNDTIIVYTSDHGDYIGHHHMWGKGCFMYDPVIGIPLVIKHQNGEKRGVNDGLSSNLDIAPTLLSLCGLPVPAGMRRRSIAEDGSAPYVLAEHRYGGNRGMEYMLRTPALKLILAGCPEKRRFYDLQKDPYELCNLADDPAYATAMEELMQMLMREILFENHSEQYLDEHAPTVGGRTYDETILRRAEAAEYYRKSVTPDGKQNH